MAITAKELAKMLKVSPATVSLALRGCPGVGDETRRRILETAAQYGYEPKEHPHSNRSGIIQLVVYKRHGKVMADAPFFDQLTEGIAQQAGLLGYHLSVSYFYGSQDPQEQLRSLKSLKSAGIILLATEMRRRDAEQFAGLEIPVVVLDNYFPSLQFDAVGIDNRQGAWLAVRYLIDCGHTRLGYLHSSVEIRNFSERQDGYLSAIRALPEEAARDAARRIIRVGISPETAIVDMRKYLAGEPMLPTAFFVDNDRIATGCCHALQEAGIRIPQEVSVIGFDDSSICQMMNPPLTTMGVQKERMGALAVNRLHERMQNAMPETVRMQVQPSIVVRSSVLDRNAPEDTGS